MGDGRDSQFFNERRTIVAPTINKTQHDIDVDPDMPLLWAIRDHTSLTGTKFGCGAGLCGACTVLINGEPTRSCQTQVSDAAGKQITTVEGLDGRVASAVQTAWPRPLRGPIGLLPAGPVHFPGRPALPNPHPHAPPNHTASHS